MSGWVPPSSKQILNGIGIKLNNKKASVNKKGQVSKKPEKEGQLSKKPDVTLLHMDVYPERLAANRFYVNLLQACVLPDPKSFKPIPYPDEDDWLGWHNTKDQSFNRYFVFTCDFDTYASTKTHEIISSKIKQIREVKGCEKAQKKF